MRNGKDLCLFGEELVSYIYDELPASKRHSFEGHLLNCSSCTSEFAEVSMSRLRVYEWHRDEFVPLETPRFEIPYASTEPALTWLDAIRSFIFTPARLSFAGGALALMVLALGVVYIADSRSIGVAEIQVPQQVIEETSSVNAPDIAKVEDKVIDDKYLEDKSLGKGIATTGTKYKSKPEIARAKTVKRLAERTLTASGNRPVKVPQLGTFEEVEDTSLRLADLVADIDSYRK